MGKPTKSIMTTDLENCFCCGRPADDTHHIYGGTGKRTESTEWGCMIPVCRFCHTEIHHNMQIMDELHKAGQYAFEEMYPSVNFRQIFGKNYI